MPGTAAEFMSEFKYRLVFSVLLISLAKFSACAPAANTSPLQSDMQVLLDFRASLPLDCVGSWSDWNTDTKVDTWHGVEVETNRVVGLYLYDRMPLSPCLTLSSSLTQLDQLFLLTVVGAKGPLPAAWANLTRLAHLDLSNNQLTGSLPKEWGALVNLEDLNLMNNMLTGSIPGEWSNLTSLQSLKLNRNRFSGALPKWKEFPLWYLDISSNQLSGTVNPSWTTFTGAAQTVETSQYNISNNRFTGALKFTWNKSDSDPGLIIDVSNNGFEGRLPTLPGATVLFNASNNRFNGSLVSLPARLQHLDLRNNTLTGSIPAISNTNLVYMQADDNLFTKLPDTIVAPKLTFLSFSNNQLRGTLPVWEHAQALVFCDLSHNSLTGTIPNPWLHDTWVLLSLHHNQLSGSLPDPMQGRTVALLLQDNNMTGCIPSVWTQNDTLVVLNVSNNPLSCQVGLPSAWGASSSFHNLSVLHISGTSISGAIPDTWLQENHLPYLIALGLEADNWWLAAKSSVQSRRAICTNDKIYDAMEWYIPETKMMKLSNIVQESIRCLPGSGFESDYVPDADLMDGVTSYASLLEDQLFQRVNLHFYGECPPEETMCGLQEAAWLVGIQWGVTGVAIMLMTLIYGIVLCWRNRKTAAEQSRQRPHAGMRPVATTRPFIADKDAVRNLKMQPASQDPSTPGATPTPSWWSTLLSFALCCPASFPAHMPHTTSGLELYSDSEDSMTPTLYRTCKKVVPWWCIFQVLLHWLDFATDIVFLVHVWPKWPAFGLVTILLFQHVFAGAMLAAQLGKLGHKTARHVVLLCLPILPLLDVVMLLTTICQNWQRIPRSLVDLALDWNKLYPMRNVSEVLMESLPASILQSVVFVLGNSTEAGWFLTVHVYLPAMVTSAFQIILLAAQVLLNSLKDKVSPWIALLDMARSSKAYVTANSAYSISSNNTRMNNFLYFASGYAAEMELLEADVEKPSPVRTAAKQSPAVAEGGHGWALNGISALNGQVHPHGKAAITPVDVGGSSSCNGSCCEASTPEAKLCTVVERDPDGSEASSSGSNHSD